MCPAWSHAQPTAVREAIAKSIIEAAKAGERDPVRLREAGLAALSKAMQLGARAKRRLPAQSARE